MAASPAPAPADPRSNGASVHAALVLVQLAFASLSVAGKVVTRTLDPGSLALVRLAGAALVFALLALRGLRQRTASPPGAQRAMPMRDVLAIMGCATLGIFGNQVMFLYGLRLTSPVNATVLVATIPVFTVLIAMVLGREPTRARTLAGVVIALAGVLWLVGGDVELGGDTALGDLLIVGNALAYALYLVLVKNLVQKHGSIRVVAIGFAFGTLLAIPIGAPALIEQAPEITSSIWWLVLYVVLVPTVFTYLANAWALGRAPASLVAIYIYVQPPVAAGLAWLFLGEVPSVRVLVAIVAVFAGIWLVTRRPASESLVVPAAGGAK